jgi:adenylate cyclase
LSQFFSPLVLDAISNEDPEKALVPREADVTVMFCDLQGFTRESERLAGDLFTLLDRVSQALGVTTHHILEHGGVIGDFHGDAAMGFWGWPMAQPDAPVRACRAALGIRSAFLEGAAADFRVGIGMASGRAVAGKIGTADQVKVTVFGPVANLAARLESLTRRVHAQILVDPAIAAAIRTNIPPEVCRVRRIARFLPLGLAAPLDVSEVISPTALTAPQLAAYEDALQAFEIGDWQQALAQLQTLPPDDAGRYFLMQFISQNHSTPPQSWDGIIRLQGK